MHLLSSVRLFTASSVDEVAANVVDAVDEAIFFYMCFPPMSPLSPKSRKKKSRKKVARNRK